MVNVASQRHTRELPGVLNWSLAGLDRLECQGRFTWPKTADAAVTRLQDLASPVHAFVRDRCRLDSETRTPMDEMWGAWKTWAALKAIGMKGKTLGELGKSFRASSYVPGQLAGVPETLDQVLQRSNAIRNAEGDAHGKSPRAPAVPQSLVNLAIHLAGAFIVYLAEVEQEQT
jgi:hypothetical protein